MSVRRLESFYPTVYDPAGLYREKVAELHNQFGSPQEEVLVRNASLGVFIAGLFLLGRPSEVQASYPPSANPPHCDPVTGTFPREIPQDTILVEETPEGFFVRQVSPGPVTLCTAGPSLLFNPETGLLVLEAYQGPGTVTGIFDGEPRPQHAETSSGRLIVTEPRLLNPEDKIKICTETKKNFWGSLIELFGWNCRQARNITNKISALTLAESFTIAWENCTTIWGEALNKAYEGTKEWIGQHLALVAGTTLASILGYINHLLNQTVNRFWRKNKLSEENNQPRSTEHFALPKFLVGLFAPSEKPTKK